MPPKKKAKACGKQAATNVSQSPLKAALARNAVQEAPPGGQASKARKLRIRSSDEKVDRLIEARLGKEIAMEQINGTTNRSGETVRSWMKQKLKVLERSKKKFSGQCWQELHAEFNLRTSPVDALPEPPEDDESEPRDALLEVLAIVHHDNPSMRKVEPACIFLEHADDLSEKELYGLLQVCQESSLITRSNAMRLQLACAKYFARTGAHTKFPEHWEIMKVVYDKMFVWLFEEGCARSMDAYNWIRKYLKELAMFMDDADLQLCYNALAAGNEPNPASLRRCLQSSLIGSTIFAEAERHLKYTVYIQDIQTQLDNLEYHQFDPNEVAAFNTIMFRLSRGVAAGGRDEFQKKLSVLSFLGKELNITSFGRAPRSLQNCSKVTTLKIGS